MGHGGPWRRANSLQVLKELVALTGIEPAGRQFSSGQLGLSSCVFGLVHYATRPVRAVRMPDVLPRCCPAALRGSLGSDNGCYRAHWSCTSKMSEQMRPIHYQFSDFARELSAFFSRYSIVCTSLTACSMFRFSRKSEGDLLS